MRTRLAATLAAASLAACAADVPADEAATTRDRLAEPTAFALVPEGATGRMLSEWEHGQGRLEPKELRATDGILVLVADPRGAISVEELSVSFDDVRIGDEGGLLEGLIFTTITASLDQAVWAQAGWTDDDEDAFAWARADLRFDWAIAREDGEPAPLSPQRIRDALVNVHLFTDDEGRLAADLSVERPGTAWAAAGVVTLSDLRFEARLSQAAP